MSVDDGNVDALVRVRLTLTLTLTLTPNPIPSPNPNPSPYQVTLICMTDLLTAAPARTDMGFNFYAGVARVGEHRA